MPTTHTSNLTGPGVTGTGLRGTVTLLRYWIAQHRVLALAIVLLATVVLVGTLRVLTSGPGGEPSVAPTATTAPAPSALPRVAADQTPPDGPLAQTPDPDAFTRSVTDAVFTWDTASSTRPDLSERLLVVADPTGEETPGLLGDLQTYLPSDQAWTHLAQYRTRQWIEITDVVEPAAWREALAQAPERAVAAGTTARTVTGVRHRAGFWHGEPVAASSPVQFTVFLVCAPTYDQCHLLRLSTPGLALH